MPLLGRYSREPASISAHDAVPTIQGNVPGFQDQEYGAFRPAQTPSGRAVPKDGGFCGPSLRVLRGAHYREPRPGPLADAGRRGGAAKMTLGLAVYRRDAGLRRWRLDRRKRGLPWSYSPGPQVSG